MLKQIEEMKELRIPSNHFVNKGEHASADWPSDIQACFWKTTEDFWMQNSKTCYRIIILC